MLHHHYKSYTNTAFRLYSKSSKLENARKKFIDRSDVSNLLDDVVDEERFGQLLLDEMNSFPAPAKAGDWVKGIVLEVADKEATVDIGSKFPAILPLEEVSLVPVKDMRSLLQRDQEITGEVLGFVRGVPLLSLRSAQLEAAWNEIAKLAKDDSSFDITVVEVTESGIIGNFLGLQCFLPGSHVLGLPDPSLVGQRINTKVLDWDEVDGRLIVSQRKALSSKMPQIQRGEVVAAKVSGLRQYGVFLELENGAIGLLHLSQISYDRVDNLEKIFHIGQQVKALVIDVEPGSGKIGLSTRALELVPGDMLRNADAVFRNAEENARIFLSKQEIAQRGREEAAKEIASAGIKRNWNDSMKVNEGDSYKVASTSSHNKKISQKKDIELSTLDSILASIVNSTANEGGSK